MSTVLLPPGVNPIAVDKYIISYERRRIKFRRRVITQKKAYIIQNTAKVWNQVTWNYCGLITCKFVRISSETGVGVY